MVFKVSEAESAHFLQEIDRAQSLTSDPDVKQALESLTTAIRYSLEFEDRWWAPVSGVWAKENENLLKLDDVKKLARKTEENTESNPLLHHGRELKTNHAVGVGFTFDFPKSSTGKDNTLPPRWREVIDNPINQEILFDDLALKAISDKEYTSGNVFIGWDVSGKKAHRIPFSQITGAITDDADPSFVKYFQRTYATTDDLGKQTSTVVEWLPADLHYRTLAVSARPKSFPSKDGKKRVSVNWNLPVVPFQPNRLDEQWLALPSCFAAVPWAIGYSQYLKGGSKLIDALSSIAFTLKSKNEIQAKRTAAQIASGKVAGVAVGSEDFELQQLPRANAVDLDTGRPLLAITASALGLSTGSLATNVLEGGYASTAAVTAIEKSYAQSRQRAFEAFYRRIFAIIGLPDGLINFNRLDADPPHRIIQAAGIARTMGFIHQKEGRGLALELLDIEGDITDLPETDEFVWSKKPILPGFLTDDPDLEKVNMLDTSSSGDAPTGSALPSQGNSGSVGSLDA